MTLSAAKDSVWNLTLFRSMIFAICVGGSAFAFDSSRQLYGIDKSMLYLTAEVKESKITLINLETKVGDRYTNTQANADKLLIRTEIAEIKARIRELEGKVHSHLGLPHAGQDE